MRAQGISARGVSAMSDELFSSIDCLILCQELLGIFPSSELEKAKRSRTTLGRLPSRRMRSAALMACSGVWQRSQRSLEQSSAEKDAGSNWSRPSMRASSGTGVWADSCAMMEATTRESPAAGWVGTISVIPPRGNGSGFLRSKSGRRASEAVGESPWRAVGNFSRSCCWSLARVGFGTA